MSKSKNKLIRYQNLIKKVDNWKSYLLKKIIGFNKAFEFKIKGFGKIKVPKNMLGPFRENFLDNIYYRYIPENILKSKANPVIVDIGANVGYFSLATFSNFKNATVYAFEPHPYCFNVLKDYQKEFKNYSWNIVNKAVGGENGELYLNTSSTDEFTTMSSIFKGKNNNEGFSVEVIKLDSFIDKEKIEAIDFIKLDCEGSEYDILYALPENLFKKINSMCIEIHKGNGENQNINALNTHLKNVGYQTKTLDEGTYTGYIWAWRT